METLLPLLASMLRKLICSAAAVYIAFLVEKGIATQAEMDKWVEITVAIVIMLATMLYSTIKEWIKNRKKA